MSDNEKPTQEETETESHVKGVENAADRGLLNRRQAERLISTGNKVNRSHDLARGIARSGGKEEP